MRVAVLGLGRMGHFYARALASSGGQATLGAAADPDARARDAIAAELGIGVLSADPLEIVARPDIDAVIIATPTSAHADLVIATAQAGKAIFCEKPLALSLDQTRAALAEVDRAGVLLQVGFMRRFDPAYREAKALIDAGRIGRTVTYKGVGRDPAVPPLEYAAHSGGLILDMGIHDFDLARWLMSSEVERVSASGARLVFDELASVGDIDNAIVNLEFQSGALGNIEVSRNARYGYDVRTEILGSTGALIVGGRGEPSSDDGVVLLSAPTTPAADDTPFFVQRFAAAYSAEIEHFIDCVEHQRQPAVGGAAALAAFEIGLAATRSQQTGRPVAVADIRAA